MDPTDLVADALRELWQPPAPGEPDRFPGNRQQAEAMMNALGSAGFAVVPTEGLYRLVEEARSRLRGRPSWSDGYDVLAADVLSMFEVHLTAE